MPPADGPRQLLASPRRRAAALGAVMALAVGAGWGLGDAWGPEPPTSGPAGHEVHGADRS